MVRYILSFAVLWFAQSLTANTDKHRLIWNDDPQTTMTIGWNQVSGQNAKVLVAPRSSDGSMDASQVQAHQPSRKVAHKGMQNYFVRLANLKPNTQYTYYIEDSEGKSRKFWFRTAPADENQPLSFIAGGDSRSDREPRKKGNLIVAKLRPHAVLFAGDMINNGTDIQWQNWMDDWQSTINADGQVIPIIPARGNHEKKNKDIHRLFDVPSRNVYYTIEFGNLFQLYTLNTEIIKGGFQAMWLRRNLKANPGITWKVAQYHKPARPHIARKPEGKGQYNHWVPAFEKYGVRLAVESDSHTHKITYPVIKSKAENADEGFVRDDEKGIVYIGEGCWGAPLQTNDDDKSWTYDSGRFYQVKWVVVKKDQLEVRTIEFDNALEVGEVSLTDNLTPPKNLKLRAHHGTNVVIIKP